MVERLAFLEVDPTAVFIARLGEWYLGYTCLNVLESDGEILTQGWTGVRPQWRRQGLATALKLVGAAYAQARGYRQIVTAPRRTNLASVRANARVGFRPRNAQMRRLLQHLKELPAWRFAAIAIGILGCLRAAWGIAGLHENEGASELFWILRFVAAVGVLFVLVQRRQTDSWTAAVQAAIIGVASQVLALLMMLPFIPRRFPSGESVAFISVAGLSIQSIWAALAVPPAAGLIWLSRYRRRNRPLHSTEK
jgi:GNAT superfamily N-acetyltransferase